MSTPDRLALRRDPDKTFVLFGAVVEDTKTDVTLVMPDGNIATHPKAGLVFVAVGSLNHFARLDPTGLQSAFDSEPRAVFEQALIDSPKPVSVSELKRRLVDAALPASAVDKAWNSLKKALERSGEVRVSGEGAARRLAWSADRSTRLAAYVSQDLPTAVVDPDVASEASEDGATAESEAAGPDPDGRTLADARAPANTAPPMAKSTSDDHTDTQDDVGRDEESPAGLIPTLRSLLGADAPASLSDLVGATLRVGSALSSASSSDLKALAAADDGEADLLFLLLLVRERLTHIRSGSGTEALPPAVASAALESTVGEATRDPAVQTHFPRFAARVVQRTALGEIPLALLCRVFVRAAACEDSSEPSRNHLDLATALADRVRSSVAQDWATCDNAVTDIARGMNRLPVDGDGPRTRFLAGLYEIRRQHLDGDLLWRNADMLALDQAAGGALRRALLDPDLAERVVKPEVLKFAAECRTRHGLGQLVALRGSFAQYVDSRVLASTMSRIAKDDRTAQEWYEGLRQQSRLEAAVTERDETRAAADEARRTANEAEQRAARVSSERDDALSALHRAIQANAQASDAQLRQAKLDVLKSLANLTVTIKTSAAALEDPALLQRVGFALRREGLTETATTGETVKYDPVLHDAQGEHIDPGAAVSVGRPGYTYDSGDEELVLVKAHVSAI